MASSNPTVQVKTATSATSPIVIQFVSNTQQYDSITVIIMNNGSTGLTVTGVTDTQLNTYTDIGNEVHSGEFGFYVWAVANIKGDTATPNTITITITGTIGGPGIQVSIIEGPFASSIRTTSLVPNSAQGVSMIIPFTNTVVGDYVCGIINGNGAGTACILGTIGMNSEYVLNSLAPANYTIIAGVSPGGSFNVTATAGAGCTGYQAILIDFASTMFPTDVFYFGMI
jgi:hypothetical protein